MTTSKPNGAMAPRSEKPFHPSNLGGGKAEGAVPAIPEGSRRPGKAPRLGESLRAFMDRTKDLPPISWLVEGLIPSIGIAWLIATGGSGKTWFALALAKAAAVDGRDVLLVEEEHSERGLRDRFTSLHLPDAALDRFRLFHRSSLKVGAGEPWQAVVNAVRGAVKPLVIIDCVAQTLKGKENEADDAARFNDGLKQLVTANGDTLVLVLHHTSKGAERAEGSVPLAGRGSSAFNGAADLELRLRPLPTPKGSGTLRFSVETTKVREFEEGDPQHVTLTLGDGTLAFQAVAKLAPDQTRQVLDAMRDAEQPLTKDAIATAVRRNRSNIGKLVDDLEHKGRLKKCGKGYVVVEAFTAGARTDVEPTP